MYNRHRCTSHILIPLLSNPDPTKKTLGSFFFHLTLSWLIVEDDGLWKTKENLLNEKGTPIYGFFKTIVLPTLLNPSICLQPRKYMLNLFS